MKKLKTCILALSAVFVLCFFINSNLIAKAESETKNLVLNDTYVSGTIPINGGADLYNITVPSAGWLTVTFQGWSIYDGSAAICSDDLSRSYGYANIYGSSSQNPKTDSYTAAIEKGTYVIKVAAGLYNNGDYKVKVSFKPANNNETEPNNYFTEAMELNLGSMITGFLSADDSIDFYKFTVPKSSKTKITIITRIPSSDFEIWNSDFVKIKSTTLHANYRASESSPITTTMDLDLSAGTYYIKAYCMYGGNKGRYQVKWDTVEETKETATETKQENKQEDVKKSNENEPAISVTVTIIKKYKVKAKSGKKVTVTWKKQSSAQKYEIQLSRDKKFAKAKSVKKYYTDKHSITIKSKTKGNHYIRLRAIDKNGRVSGWSKVYKLRIK